VRLYALSRAPLFCDEDLYVHGVRRMAGETGLSAWTIAARYCTKPPLVFELMRAATFVLHDRVAGARVVSAVAGLASVLGTFAVGRRVAGPAAGVSAALAYAVSPLAVLHERMALMDATLAAAALWAIVTTWRALEDVSFPRAFLAALLGACAVLSKAPGVVAAAAPLLLAFTCGPHVRRLGVAALAAAGPVAAYAALRLGPLGRFLEGQDAERLAAPFTFFEANAGVLGDALASYLPLGLPVLALIGVGLVARREARMASFLVGMALLWSVPWLVFSNFGPSRYHYPALPIVLALAAGVPRRLAAEGVRPALVLLAKLWGAVILAASLVVSAWLVVDHRTAPLAALDDWQYRSGWPSGYGFAEARALLDARAGTGSCVAFVMGGLHEEAAGVEAAARPGRLSLGRLDAASLAARPRDCETFVLAEPPGAADVQAAIPTATVLDRFDKPGGAPAVFVLRIPPSAR
jgi:4-amino-4-deoxy-L-arabinose transferase-like glycosyltransferase